MYLEGSIIGKQELYPIRSDNLEYFSPPRFSTVFSKYLENEEFPIKISIRAIVVFKGGDVSDQTGNLNVVYS